RAPRAPPWDQRAPNTSATPRFRAPAVGGAYGPPSPRTAAASPRTSLEARRSRRSRPSPFQLVEGQRVMLCERHECHGKATRGNIRRGRQRALELTSTGNDLDLRFTALKCGD